jgi:hypothetical protein
VCLDARHAMAMGLLQQALMQALDKATLGVRHGHAHG